MPKIPGLSEQPGHQGKSLIGKACLGARPAGEVFIRRHIAQCYNPESPVVSPPLAPHVTGQLILPDFWDDPRSWFTPAVLASITNNSPFQSQKHLWKINYMVTLLILLQFPLIP